VYNQLIILHYCYYNFSSAYKYNLQYSADIIIIISFHLLPLQLQSTARQGAQQLPHPPTTTIRSVNKNIYHGQAMQSSNWIPVVKRKKSSSFSAKVETVVVEEGWMEELSLQRHGVFKVKPRRRVSGCKLIKGMDRSGIYSFFQQFKSILIHRDLHNRLSVGILLLHIPHHSMLSLQGDALLPSSLQLCRAAQEMQNFFWGQVVAILCVATYGIGWEINTVSTNDIPGHTLLILNLPDDDDEHKREMIRGREQEIGLDT
jgi:hypothetical protein